MQSGREVSLEAIPVRYRLQPLVLGCVAFGSRRLNRLCALLDPQSRGDLQ